MSKESLIIMSNIVIFMMTYEEATNELREH